MKKLRIMIALVLVIALVLAACGQPAPAPAPAPDPGQATETPAEPPAAPDEDEGDEEEADEPEDTGDAGDVLFGDLPGTLPRNESLYFGGLQWGTPVSNNPFTVNPNNGIVIEHPASGARVSVFETLYMFNMLDGLLHPLLADGPYTWSGDMSYLAVNINPNAHFNNGTPVTSRDVVVTFDMHSDIGTPLGLEYVQFISEVTAEGDHTVHFHLDMDNFNPPRVLEWLGRVFILSADFLEAKMAEHGGNVENFRNDPWFEHFVTSGPYMPVFLSSQMVVLERDDNYWGQHSSMWGTLPAPRYLVHNIYASNDVKRASFAAGQIDMNQQFMANVWDLWETDGAPVSTFLDNPPFYVPGSMPSIWFNTTRPGLDQRAVRQAIAFAIDYEQIISAAMSGYSPTFAQAPRSIALPGGEQRFVDNTALADLQWGNQDIERAIALLDEAGIVDTTGDGIREWEGENLSFTLMCPMGWSDWEASLEIVAAAGALIGIDLSTNFVDAPVWTESQQTGDFDIIMIGTSATSISAPWSRAFHALHVEDPNADRVFWGFHRLHDPAINEVIMAAGAETNEAAQREYFTQISRFLLEEMPLVYLMYRPWLFHTVNESVWTSFPEYGDGTNVPPQVMLNGFGIAGLYNLTLVD